ncbi:MAG: hypothetical protein KJS92_04400 [Bacteroidetes bacterium]|nr:hypothetical protein [Bacteroidota bacterium]
MMLLAAACTKKERISYGLLDQELYEDKTLKTKNKNESEYISILYTNLYQKPISPNELYKTQNVVYSIGDRTLAYEMLLSNYFNQGTVQIPSNNNMRGRLDSFVLDTYKRFYLRYPSEAEKTWFRNYIQANPDASVEMVYTAFAASDEYSFY